MGLLKEIRARQNDEPPSAEPPVPGPPNPALGPPPEPDPDGITRGHMFSNVLGGAVPISWTPDGGTVWVDGVPYTAREIDELMVRHPDPETMRGIHNVKKTFDATIN